MLSILVKSMIPKPSLLHLDQCIMESCLYWSQNRVLATEYIPTAILVLVCCIFLCSIMQHYHNLSSLFKVLLKSIVQVLYPQKGVCIIKTDCKNLLYITQQVTTMEYTCNKTAHLKFCVHLCSVHIHKKTRAGLLPTYQKLELQNSIGLQRK